MDTRIGRAPNGIGTRQRQQQQQPTQTFWCSRVIVVYRSSCVMIERILPRVSSHFTHRF